MNEGKKDRRDPIRTIKAKNPVAKNASAAIGGGAAGAHKDKKKAAKQGDVKHKKAEYAESYETRLTRQLEEATVNPQFINAQVTKILAGEARRMTNAPLEQLLAPLMKEYNLTLQQINGMVPGGLKKAAGEYGVMVKGIAEGGYDYNRPDPAWVTINGKRWKWFFNYVSARKAMDTLNAKFRKEGSNKKADWEPADLEDNPDYGIKIGEAANGITGPGMMDTRPSEGADYDQGEYNDEAGMAQGNLYTIAKAANGLLDTIDDQDNLPEWVQEKISKVEGMLVTVWNYLQSQKAQGIDPQVSEGSALEKFRKGAAEREKKHADIEAKRKAKPGDSAGAIDRLAKHMDSKTESLRTENPCWKGYKPVGTKKKGGKTVPNCVPKEGWTHDSLADELFEHERTYEEQLQSKLKKQLGK